MTHVLPGLLQQVETTHISPALPLPLQLRHFDGINMPLLASCLIYARAFIEYICECVLFQDVTVRENRGR